jgi:protein disulfide-isomerase A1
MAKILALLQIVLLLVVVTCADQPNPTESSKVLTLDEANFDKALLAHPYLLVEFYAPWCGHCQQLAPEYELAANGLADTKDVRLAKVDVSSEKALAQRFNIRSLPTIFFFRGGIESEYNGGRTSDTIQKWVRKNIRPPTTVVTSLDEEMAYLQRVTENTLVFGIFTSTGSEFHENFLAAAKDPAFQDLDFGEKIDSEVGDKIQIFPKQYQGEQDLTYDPAKHTLSIEAWLLEKAFPLVGGLSESEIARYQKKNLPLTVLFFDPNNQEQSQHAIDLYTESVAPLSSLSSFAAANGVPGLQNFRSLGYQGGLPVVAVSPLKSNRALFKEITQDLTTEELREWIKDGNEGKIKLERLSQPKPEKDAEPGQVAVVVGNTVQELVLDPSKDVLLEVYAPWCGHCQKLEPIYEELAKSFKDTESVRIAKLDGSSNEQDLYDVQGFPTILFFPANNKTPIVFSGARTLEGLRAFVLEHQSVAGESDHDEL